MHLRAQLLHEAMNDADEITAVHTPDPALLRIARSPQTSQVPQTAQITRTPQVLPSPQLLQSAHFPQNHAENSEITQVVLRPPPPPSRRAKIRIMPLQTLRALLARYTEAAGPAARPLMLKAIADLQATPEQFPALLRGELVRALSQRLDNLSTRTSFIEDAERITQ